MIKKMIVLVFALGCLLNSDAQIRNEFFEFGEDIKISYSKILVGKRSSVKFYVIFNQSPEYERAVKASQKKGDHKVFFILTIPKEIASSQEQEELFLAYASHILGSMKLIDKDMYVISDKDYTGLYEKVRQQNEGIYNYGRLNEIYQIYIGKLPEEVCKIIGN